ncbi:MAG: hypothetical protein KDJ38_06375 [Gammaproteobacteria bacterium]|nr:hypothetical protein [Gammaproteobacteria bacterium]
MTILRSVILTHNGSMEAGPLEIHSVYLDERDSRFFSVDVDDSLLLYPGESREINIYLTIPSEELTTPLIEGFLYISHSGEQGISIVKMTAQLTQNTTLDQLQSRATPSISFFKSTLSGSRSEQATSLQFGPDGRLYVADMMGVINIYTLQRSGSNNYQVVATETLTQIRNIVNHDDDGSVNSAIKNRLVTGILVTGSSAKPVIYVLSSDPRFGGGTQHTDTNLDTNSTMLSRLDRNNGQWVRTDLVRGLPRSEENHHGNGMALSQDGKKLYLAMGGNTNAGAVSNNFALLPEFALSAAILEVDLPAIGNNTYDLPTLDDEDRPGSIDFNDPFGGNQGKNQAKLIPNGPVTVYAPGFRNPYDIVITQAGRMYSIDNGPNAGWGDIPKQAGPEGVCSNALNEPGNTRHDNLHHITHRGYYAGHANPTRGNVSNTFNAGNPQSPVQQANPVECDYQVGTSKSTALLSFAPSTNGLDEYTASNFDGQLTGNLLAAAWDNTIFRIQLNQDGSAVSSHDTLFSNVGVRPLDVIALGDDEMFPGTIWVADLATGNIIVFEPADYEDRPVQQCDPSAGTSDQDNDGFSNNDELLNETDPCSAADFPADFDGDFSSDLLDTDDDNDGIEDAEDPFALDPDNGATTSIPLRYDWENDDGPPGGILNLGFTGLMTNGSQDYNALFDQYQITAGGAAGVLTIDNIAAGDAYKSKNTQEYAFQFGINVSSQSPVFTVHSRILAPFAGLEPGKNQSMGIFIGTGDQDNYLKLVINGTPADGGLQLLKELNGNNISDQNQADDIFGADAVDLYLEVNPTSALVQAKYQISHQGIPGPMKAFPNSMAFPQTWLNSPTKLAVGILATSVGGSPFPGTWDLIEIQTMLEDDPGANQAPQVDAGPDQSLGSGDKLTLNGAVQDDGLPANSLSTSWSKTSGPGSVSFSNAASLSSQVEFSQPGSYQLKLTASDGALTGSDSINIVVQEASSAATAYRINVGGPALTDPTGDWLSDAQAAQYVNTGKVYQRDVEINTEHLSQAVPAALFNSERWDEASLPEMHWQFPVVPGDYDVRVYFAEIWPGAYKEGARLFSVAIEGMQLDDIDVYALAGKETATMIETRVTSDATLDIEFQHIVQNPGVKGIEIIPATTVGNNPPLITLDSSFTTTIDTPFSLSAAVSDDGLPDGTLNLAWEQISGPGTVSFDAVNSPETAVVFSKPGTYQLKVSASDGELISSKQTQVVVNGSTTSETSLIRINVGGPTINDPNGDWLADTIANATLNSGSIYSNKVDIDTSGLEYQVPEALFQTERWDGAAAPEMHWQIPVEPGVYEVRLYFAEIWDGAFTEGKRVFSVNVEGIQSPAIDVYKESGSYKALAYTFHVTSDNSLDILFTHITQNPSLKGIEILSSSASPSNQPPLVLAGEEINTSQTAGIQLNASVSDDGLPDGTLTVSWNKLLGPGSVSFSDASIVNPLVSVSEPGAYLLGITASDGEYESTDALDLYITSPTDNTAPVVDAGSDLSVTQDEEFSLQATVSDDGLPNGQLDFSWRQLSGPGVISFTAADQPNSRATADIPGTYVLQLDVSDGELNATDTIQISVQEDTSGKQQAIRINAGGPTLNQDGIQWLSDADALNYVNTGKLYQKVVDVDLSGLDSSVPEALFHTSRWDPANGAEMAWAIPLSAGLYQVNLYFAETWSEAFGLGNRVFSVNVEGAALNTVDIFAAAGSNKALMYSVTVQADATLDIAFTHQTENPTINAIEVIPLDAATENLAPSVLAGADTQVDLGTTLALNGTVTDDGLPNASLSISWSKRSGPGTVSFSDSNNPRTTADFSAAGDYVLELQAYDGALTSEDTLKVSVRIPDAITQISANQPWIQLLGKNGTQPDARHEAGAVAVNNKMYLMGGRDTRAVNQFDPGSGKWQRLATPPREMHHFQPVAIGNTIYVIGAMGCCYPKEENIPNIYIYNTQSNSWSVGPLIPEQRRRGSTGTVIRNGKIYLVGGNTKGHSGGAVNWFDEYDPASNTWRQLPDAPHARDHFNAVLIGDRLVVAGGRVSSQPDVFAGTLAKVDVYDFSTGAWRSDFQNIPTQRAGTMAVAFGKEAIVIGGESTQSTQAHNQVEAFNPYTGKWRTLQALITGRHSGGAAVLADGIHVAAGNSRRGGGSETSLHEFLDTP